jgi:site-specific DNA-methyltransferase (adenine-specific)
MTRPRIVYRDDRVVVWHGDCRDVLPQLDETPLAAVTDPPYGETAAEWDRWPDGWVEALGEILPANASLWSFGSARMFLEHVTDFTGNGWKFAQEALWIKRNGSGPTGRDRLVKVHEWAYLWYRGLWSAGHHEWERDRVGGPPSARYARKDSRAAAHQRPGRATRWDDDGTRQPRSVTYVVEVPSVRGRGRHQDEKPLGVVMPLVRECAPPDGLVVDPMAGTGTTAVAAILTGRRAVVIERDAQLCRVIVDRVTENTVDAHTRG